MSIMALDFYNTLVTTDVERFHLPIVGQVGLKIAFESSFTLSPFCFKNRAILNFYTKMYHSDITLFQNSFSTST